jgi:hypothetical protein
MQIAAHFRDIPLTRLSCESIADDWWEPTEDVRDAASRASEREQGTAHHRVAG